MNTSAVPTKVGKYSVEKELHGGGMGFTYLARTPEGQRVVLKVALEMKNAALDNEASMLSQFRHHNIVRVLAGEQDGKPTFVQRGFVDGEARFFTVLEYIEGHPLNRIEGLGVRGVARAIRETAAALDHAHQRHVLHLDVKSANILVTQGMRRVVLIDWGTAQVMRSNKAPGPEQGMFFTAEYVSPERARGEPVDARADIYSLGVIAFELLTGKVPFKKQTDKETARAHIHEPLPEEPLRKLPPSVQAVLRKALAKNRDERYASAREFARELERAMPRVFPSRLVAAAAVCVIAAAGLGYGAFAQVGIEGSTVTPSPVGPGVDVPSPPPVAPVATAPTNKTPPGTSKTILAISPTAQQKTVGGPVATSTLAPSPSPTNTPAPVATRPPIIPTPIPTEPVEEQAAPEEAPAPAPTPVATEAPTPKPPPTRAPTPRPRTSSGGGGGGSGGGGGGSGSR